ncbi:MAG: PTS sugar transporter subunit IIA [Gemella sp.]|nr:PTS sugar transporter subunit IIA [Gemella sp.]
MEGKYFSKENIYLDVEGTTFEEILKNVNTSLVQRGKVKESFYEAVLEREKTFPTGLEFPGYNIAIPHTDSVHVNTNSIVVVKPKNPIVFRDMGTNSKELEVKVLLLLLISKNEDQVTVLSGIIKQFADAECYQNILESSSEEEIYNIITK